MVNSAAYLDLAKACLPELALTATSLLVLFLDLVWARELEDTRRRRVLLAAFLSGGALALLTTFLWPFAGIAPGGMWSLGATGLVVKQGLIVMGLLSACLMAPGDWSEHAGEYLAVLALALVGMLCMASAEHLLMIFASVELASLSLYILTALNKGQRESTEAGLKYFLFGGVAAAFLLYGFSLLYGATGEMTLKALGAKLAAGSPDPLVWVAVAMVVAGFGFKVAVVPFHWWAPDVYQGAPAASAALIASGSKVASFWLMLKFMGSGLAGAAGDGSWGHFVSGWMPLLAGVAALSMVMGNIAALGQSSVRRLLAFSAVSHGGYLLLGILAQGEQGAASVVFYSLVYGFSSIGAFGVVSFVENAAGHDRFDAFTGLSKRSPVLAFSLMALLLSLAGVPPLAGFFGKFYLFAAVAAVKPLGWMWLVSIAIAMSCVSLYYYLLVLKQAYVAAPTREDMPPLEIPLCARLTVLFVVVVLFVLGFFPEFLLGRIHHALKLGVL